MAQLMGRYGLSCSQGCRSTHHVSLLLSSRFPSPNVLGSPWNYPIGITFSPLAGCIAAGCPAVLKPSEHSPAASALMAFLVPKYLDSQAYVVVQGTVGQATALLDLPWGHIFFTGGIRTARQIAVAAAQFVTPLTLELGGKGPVIIDPDCDIELAAKRTLYGKVQNSGQVRNILITQLRLLTSRI